MTACKRTASLLILACTLHTAAQAETIKLKLAPGLWEQTSTTLINGQNMEEMMRKQMDMAMSKMNAEQRAQMEKSMGKMQAGGKREACLSAAQVAKGVDVDAIRKQASKDARDCTMTTISANESGGKFEMNCTSPHGGSHKGVGEYKVKNDKEWTFEMNSSGDMPNPHGSSSKAAAKMQVNVKVQARWKSADCGSVAPIE